MGWSGWSESKVSMGWRKVGMGSREVGVRVKLVWVSKDWYGLV